MKATDTRFDWHRILDKKSTMPRQRLVFVGDGRIFLCSPSQDYTNTWKSPIRCIAQEVAIGFGVFIATLFVILQCRNVLPDKIGVLIMVGAGVGIWIAFFVRLQPHITKLGNHLAIRWIDLANLRTAGKPIEDALDYMRQQGFTIQEFAAESFTDAVVGGKISKRMTSADANIDWSVSGNLVKTLQSYMDS